MAVKRRPPLFSASFHAIRTRGRVCLNMVATTGQSVLTGGGFMGLGKQGRGRNSPDPIFLLRVWRGAIGLRADAFRRFNNGPRGLNRQSPEVPVLRRTQPSPKTAPPVAKPAKLEKEKKGLRGIPSPAFLQAPQRYRPSRRQATRATPSTSGSASQGGSSGVAAMPVTIWSWLRRSPSQFPVGDAMSRPAATRRNSGTAG